MLELPRVYFNQGHETNSSIANTSRRSKKSKPYDRSARGVTNNFDDELNDFFFGPGYALGYWTRGRKKRGINHSCMLTQRLVLIRYVLRKICEDFNNIEHANFERNILYLIIRPLSQATKYFNGQSQKVGEYLMEKSGEDCVNKIQHLINISGMNFTRENSINIKKFSFDDVTKLFEENSHYPIPLAFGIDKVGLKQEIDHWFILYQNKIYGAAGAPGMYYKLSMVEIQPIDFYDFLQCMNSEPEDSDPVRTEKFKFFDSFMRIFFVPEDSVVYSGSPAEVKKKNR